MGGFGMRKLIKQHPLLGTIIAQLRQVRIAPACCCCRVDCSQLTRCKRSSTHDDRRQTTSRVSSTRILINCVKRWRRRQCPRYRLTPSYIIKHQHLSQTANITEHNAADGRGQTKPGGGGGNNKFKTIQNNTAANRTQRRTQKVGIKAVRDKNDATVKNTL